MPFCRFSKGSAMFDVTPIENMFLLEYLPSAPEGFLRVYLYARMLCLHPELGGDISEMAKTLNMNEDQIVNALSYWEHQGLVERLSDRPLSYALKPLNAGNANRSAENREYDHYVAYNSGLQEIFGAGELLSARHYRTANDWLNVFGFTQDGALKLLEYEIRQPGGKKPDAVFRRANRRAIEWAERGISTAEDVEKAISFNDRIYTVASAVLKQLSISRKPSVDELNCVQRWIVDWKLDEKTILSACAQTTTARSPSIGYLDAILKNRREGTGEKYFDAVKAVLRDLGAVALTPTPELIGRYEALLEAGFDAQTVSLAAAQCARKHKNSFEELEWMLGRWAQAGVFKREQAEKYLMDMRRMTDEVRTLLEKAGLTRRPTMDDIEKYEKWKKAYGRELVFYAAEAAVGTNMPMRYMAKLLSEWEKANIKTPEEAKIRKAQAAAPQQNYQQREYRQEDYGSDFFYDPAADYQNGGDGK